MYICIAYCYNEVRYNEVCNDKDTLYRIYDTETDTYKDMHYIDICSALSNGTIIGNINLKGKKLVGDNIDILKLKTPSFYDMAVIIWYIRDKNGNTLGYDIIWQTGNKSYCTYNEAIHMIMNKRVVNAILVNKRVRLSSTRVMGERIVDANKFHEQAYSAYKERKEAVSKRDDVIHKSSFRVTHPKYKFVDNDMIAAIIQDEKEKEEIQRKIANDESVDTSIHRNKHQRSNKRSSNKEQTGLASAMLKEYATPGPFRNERAIMKMFKR